MPRHDPLYQWTARVSAHFPAPTARTLARWAYGLVLAHRAGLTAVAVPSAAALGQAVNTVRQRLKAFDKPAAKKKGRGRTELDPAACRGPLVRRVAGGWPDKRVALAPDVTNVGSRFHVLTAAVRHAGGAVPAAWAVLPGGVKDPWRPHWVAVLGRVKAALGDGWTVLVLTDRGLESPALFREITGHGWRPVMRVKAGGKFRPAGWRRFDRLGAFAARAGDRFAAAGLAYAGERLPRTLLACRRPGCADPWLLLTDLPPGAADPCRYAYRSWIEQGFKVLKSGGWDREASRVTAPDRAARQWVVPAVATVWLIEAGGLAGAAAETVPPVPKLPRPPRGRPRGHRLFAVGLGIIVAGLLAGAAVVGRFVQDAWPAPEPVPNITEAEFIARPDLPL